jgi:hypothetical protein
VALATWFRAAVALIPYLFITNELGSGRFAEAAVLRCAPPADWPLERRQEYVNWARLVVDGLRGIHSRLEALFDAEVSLPHQGLK